MSHHPSTIATTSSNLLDGCLHVAHTHTADATLQHVTLQLQDSATVNSLYDTTNQQAARIVCHAAHVCNEAAECMQPVLLVSNDLLLLLFQALHPKGTAQSVWSSCRYCNCRQAARCSTAQSVWAGAASAVRRPSAYQWGGCDPQKFVARQLPCNKLQTCPIMSALSCATVAELPSWSTAWHCAAFLSCVLTCSPALTCPPGESAPAVYLQRAQSCQELQPCIRQARRVHSEVKACQLRQLRNHPRCVVTKRFAADCETAAC